jgi:hypothetical protein
MASVLFLDLLQVFAMMSLKRDNITCMINLIREAAALQESFLTSYLQMQQMYQFKGLQFGFPEAKISLDQNSGR